MQTLILGSIYLMFFLSGASALMYEVIWVRSLGLVFGGTHLAVTSVLSVFMAGLAIGSYTIGRYVDRVEKPLRLYGLLELGIAVFAVVFAGLIKVYPSIYIFLAQGREDSHFYLSCIRVVFAVLALIIPTTLMGGTLPVLTRFVTGDRRKLGTQLSLLYGFNTLGAVAGTAAAGFYFLRFFSLSTTLTTAIVINVFIGLSSLLLQKKSALLFRADENVSGRNGKDTAPPPMTENTLPFKLVLWGIGVSGFCALGYEILWTRILTIVVGASVYGFTTMLAAFLTGIALGSKAYGLFIKIFGAKEKGIGWSVSGFGVVQIIIGITALLVTFHIRHLPADSIELRDYLGKMDLGLFGVMQWANLIIAFFYMLVPAFFMGLAFPLAGMVHGEYRKLTGSATGEVLAYNTAGAILGAVMSGFVLTFFFGIERSLQMLTVINIGFGLIVITSRVRQLTWGIAVYTAGVLFFMAVNTSALRMWDMKYFAIFRTNQTEAFRTKEMVREALDHTDVLYYAEGVESTVSSIRIKGGVQTFLTNGRAEASTHLADQQTQYTLGHLPMLLNKDPKKVLVVALGSGMTLGATLVHPSVEQVTLVEIEPKVTGVARTFEKYNHHALDNPKLRTIFNDGRNFLLTTKEKFDVITADPIHPWFRGAGYLYTSEYFKLASEHLREGGVMCQWLPIYELTVEDLKSVMRTFSGNFRYTVMWFDYNDATLIGSNSPIVLDEAELNRRIAVPEIADDLRRVMMYPAREFLNYFVMGTEGMKAFGEDGTINTDDNLYLEFSAPFSIGKFFLMEENANNISRYRESIIPYLAPVTDDRSRQDQMLYWQASDLAARVYDRAHALALGEKFLSPEFRQLLDKLDKSYPWYGPGRFINYKYLSEMSKEPRLLQAKSFIVLSEEGERTELQISAVLSRISGEMTVIDFVDNKNRVIYGQLYLPGDAADEIVNQFVSDVMAAVNSAYLEESAAARYRGSDIPPVRSAESRIKDVIKTKVDGRENAIKKNSIK
ncbi:MAG: fused MFS/spermidine synthase [Nitrospirae bacterium]|nr:fused MFS/spermidine synthase [Nitrospirota bacterium]